MAGLWLCCLTLLVVPSAFAYSTFVRTSIASYSSSFRRSSRSSSPIPGTASCHSLSSGVHGVRNGPPLHLLPFVSNFQSHHGGISRSNHVTESPSRLYLSSSDDDVGPSTPAKTRRKPRRRRRKDGRTPKKAPPKPKEEEEEEAVVAGSVSNVEAAPAAVAAEEVDSKAAVETEAEAEKKAEVGSKDGEEVAKEVVSASASAPPAVDDTAAAEEMDVAAAEETEEEAPAAEETATADDEKAEKGESTPTPPVEPKRPPSFVEMEVKDVRDILSSPPSPPPTAAEEEVTVKAEEDDEEEEEDEDEWEYFDEDEEDDEDEYEYIWVDDDGKEQKPLPTGAASVGTMEDLQKFIAADKARLELEVEKEEEEGGAMVLVKRVITTIVTVDFFVVMGLFLWFMTGIFFSYVVKDDGIQIAFNKIFEPVVQPALGILMLGSALGAAFGGGEEEEEEFK